jgi:hypothetical protein
LKKGKEINEKEITFKIEKMKRNKENTRREDGGETRKKTHKEAGNSNRERDTHKDIKEQQ